MTESKRDHPAGIISYLIPGMAVEVKVHSDFEAHAVREFATINGYPCPAPKAARPVYWCVAKTHPNNEVLWA